MDEKLKQDILSYYHDKYYQSALAEKPGLIGKLMRWHERTEGQWAARGLDFTGIATLGILVGSAALTSVVGSIALVGIFAAPTYLVGLLAGGYSVSNTATKAMEKDIALLAGRYKEDVLGKKLQAIPAAKEAALREVAETEAELTAQSQQLDELALKAPFTAACSGEETPACPSRTATPEAPKQL